MTDLHNIPSWYT